MTFFGSARNLDIDFDWIITAEQAKAKPSLHNFELAIEKIGLPSERYCTLHKVFIMT